MSEVMAAMHSTMEAVYNITYKLFHVFPNHDTTTNALLFISSVARYGHTVLTTSDTTGSVRLNVAQCDLVQPRTV